MNGQYQLKRLKMLAYSEGGESTDEWLLAVRANGEPAPDMSRALGLKVYTSRRRHGKRNWNQQKGRRGI